MSSGALGGGGGGYGGGTGGGGGGDERDSDDVVCVREAYRRVASLVDVGEHLTFTLR